MKYLEYINKENIKIINKYTTPMYVYFEDELIKNINIYKDSFKNINMLFCYALKANSNKYLTKIIAKNSFGADVVSGGELKLALLSGFEPNKIIFSGVGKTKEELSFAIEKNIKFINIESFDEMKELNNLVLKKKKNTNFSIRINPNVDPHTHKYISTGLSDTKFGVSFKEAFEIYKFSRKNKYLNPIAIHFHLGSQIFSHKPYELALNKVLSFLNKLKDIKIDIKTIDIGGGWGVKEGNDLNSPKKILEIIEPHSKSFNFIMEPGRSLVASTGLLIMKVLYIKKSGARHIIITDAGMNDFIRPSLYGVNHPIMNLNEKKNQVPGIVDIVGPVCESGDFFIKGLNMKVPDKGDILAILSAGAYGYSMSSNYNLRLKPLEILISQKGVRHKIIRKRENYNNLFNY